MTLESIIESAWREGELTGPLYLAGEAVMKKSGADAFAVHLQKTKSNSLQLVLMIGAKPLGTGFSSIDFGRYPNAPGLVENGIVHLEGGDSRLNAYRPHIRQFESVLLCTIGKVSEPLGILWVFFRKKTEITTDVSRFIENLSSSLSHSLQQDSRRKSHDEAEAKTGTLLQATLINIITAEETPEILRSFAEYAANVVGANHFFVLSRENRHGKFRIISSKGVPEHKFKDLEIRSSLVIEAGIFENDVLTLNDSTLKDMGIRAERGKWFSFSFGDRDCFVIAGADKRAIGHTAIESAMKGPTGAVAKSLELLRSRIKTRDYIEKIKIISKIAQELIIESDLDSLFKKIFESLNRVIIFPRGALYVYDRQRGRLNMVHQKNIPEDLVGVKEKTALTRHHGIVKETLAPILTGDARTDSRLDYAEGPDHPISVLCVPLVFREHYMGDITLSSPDENFFTHEDLHIATIFANFTAVLIENLVLRREAVARESRLRASDEISSLISVERSLEKILLFCLGKAKEIYPFENAAMLRLAGDDFIAQEYIEDSPFFSKKRRIPRASLMKLTLNFTRLTVVKEEALSKSEFSPLIEDDVSEVLLIPVPQENGLFGFLFFSTKKANLFSDPAISWLLSLSSQVTIAVGKSSLFDSLEKTIRQLEETMDHMVQNEKLRALGQLASGVAHDFNNVLAAIMGRAELIKRKVESGELSEKDILRSINIIITSSLDGAQTLKKIQEYTKKEKPASLTAVNLNDLAADVRDITMAHWKDRAEKRGIHYRFEIEAGNIPHAAANPAELREALVNLTLNALDAMQEGGSITVKTGMEGKKLFISVSDTGIGIPESLKNKIFEPFFTTKESGSGLGLSVVQSIVERMDGSVKFHSIPKEGTVFTIHLQVSNGKLPETEAGGKIEESSFESLRILVVDDEKEVLQILEELLVTIGHSVRGTISPREAIDVAEKEPFDLIISDIGMPEITGWALIDKIRTKGIATPVLLVSGWAESIPEEKVVQEGGAGILPKPFKIDDLKNAISRIDRSGGTS